MTKAALIFWGLLAGFVVWESCILSTGQLHSVERLDEGHRNARGSMAESHRRLMNVVACLFVGVDRACIFGWRMLDDPRRRIALPAVYQLLPTE